MNLLNQNRKKESSIQELHAQEAKDLLLYAAQEGGENDVKIFYEGLDIDKLVDFIRKENGNLETYPAVIAKVFLEDKRLPVRQALEKFSSLYSHSNFFSLKDWEELHDLTPESVIKNGRRCALSLLRQVKEEDKTLNERELNAVGSMAINIPDEEVMEVIQELSAQNYRLAIELVFNPSISSERLESIVKMALERSRENVKWNNVIMEVVAYHFDQLSDEMVQRLEEAPDPIPSYIAFFKKDSNETVAVELGKGKKKSSSRKNLSQKKKEREKKRAQKEIHWETVKRVHEGKTEQDTYF